MGEGPDLVPCLGGPGEAELGSLGFQQLPILDTPYAGPRAGRRTVLALRLDPLGGLQLVLNDDLDGGNDVCLDTKPDARMLQSDEPHLELPLFERFDDTARNRALDFRLTKDFSDAFRQTALLLRHKANSPH